MSILTRCLVWPVLLLLGSVLPTLATLDPPPDGGYPNENTAEGDGALDAVTTGRDCTALGFQALNDNTTGPSNTAVGSQALLTNVTGGSNTAVGAFALEFFDSGGQNFNTAVGASALEFNNADFNTAVGASALAFNDAGSGNVAIGFFTAQINRGGSSNSAFGTEALRNNANGNANTAIGNLALTRCKGSNNIALGASAGVNIKQADNNIDLGNAGVSGDSNTIRIGSNLQTQTFISGISGTTVAGGVGVIIDSTGKLGTVTSSARYKKNIQPMDRASEKILALHPVTFEYKEELDPKGIPQFGLVAEDVAKVNPDLVARDEQGKPYTVRYEAVNAMLLNEFLKEHQKVEQQQKQIDVLETELNEQKALIQKVTDRLDL